MLWFLKYKYSRVKQNIIATFQEKVLSLSEANSIKEAQNQAAKALLVKKRLSWEDQNNDDDDVPDEKFKLLKM